MQSQTTHRLTKRNSQLPIAEAAIGLNATHTGPSTLQISYENHGYHQPEDKLLESFPLSAISNYPRFSCHLNSLQIRNSVTTTQHKYLVKMAIKRGRNEIKWISELSPATQLSILNSCQLLRTETKLFYAKLH